MSAAMHPSRALTALARETGAARCRREAANVSDLLSTLDAAVLCLAEREVLSSTTPSDLRAIGDEIRRLIRAVGEI